MCTTAYRQAATAVSDDSFQQRSADSLIRFLALHFKLTIEPEGDGRTTSFEEVEFLYTPLLDANRDRGLIELLPYYLKEDITFSRHHAAKFYSRVVDALTKKAEEE